MTTPIDNLVDDCLLHIFDYLDPLSCVSAAQVCKRWEELARRTLSKVTDLHLNNPKYCFNLRPRMKIFRETTSPEIIKSALQYIGPEVKLIHLGICESDAIVFKDYYSYQILGDDYNADEFISMLSQSCTNVEELQIKTISSDLKFVFEQFSKSSRKLKKVTLPEVNLTTFPSGFDSVEEVTWSVYRDFNVEHFGSLFPNVKMLKLLVDNSPNDFEPFVASILRQIKHLKSLNLYINNYGSSQKNLRILLDISAFPQLEELQISSKAILHAEDFEADSITKLIESCQNLRVVNLQKFGLGTIDVSSFLTLPKLEQLDITNARFFTSESLSKIKLNQFEKLTRLRIDFNYYKSLNYSGMCDAIRKMPALEFLIVNAIPDERQAVEFTCKVIEKLINDRDIIVMSGLEQAFRVYKNGDPELKSEPLKMKVRPRGIVHYFKEVHKFVSRLQGCSFIVWSERYKDMYKDCFEEYSMYSFCDCHYTVYSGFGPLSDTSESEENSD